VGKDDNVTIEELRELSDAAGCQTQADFAALLGITQSHVSRLLSGEKRVGPGTLLLLIRRLQAEYLPPKKRRPSA
jgi:transcriptional regulator with XRE-family HTH domain